VQELYPGLQREKERSETVKESTAKSIVQIYAWASIIFSILLVHYLGVKNIMDWWMRLGTGE